MVNKTLDYYNENADTFSRGTVAVDFRQTQDRFLRELNRGDYILDFGCGSGRDTKYFTEQGYQVDATDGSVELVKYASEYTGVPVKHMLFQELNENEKYDGIWACSSILHLPLPELKDVFIKMSTALKPGGYIYASFKYGTFSGERNGRFFTDMTEDSLSDMIAEIKGLSITELWTTADVRPGRSDEKWLNVLLQKTE